LNPHTPCSRLALQKPVIQVAILIRAPVRVAKVCRWTYSTLRTLLNASLTALSKQDPTLPMGCRRPACGRPS
jgi:hypothetical protein